jgi:uncharacterized protein
MTEQESALLQSALVYENGHPRRTQHILKVYALAGLLAAREGLDEEDGQILRAAAILHDIPIKYCKEHDGDACQANQRRAAPGLVQSFLTEAGYPAAWLPRVLELVERHHDYTGPRDTLLQLLIEADLIVNCYEERPEEAALSRLVALFRTEAGKALFQAAVQGTAPADKGGI